jgi:polyisoprenyl-teichoic acid--peptidoglycan teichoic acid transferase
VSMVDDLGGVTVHSDLDFTTDEGNVHVQQGPNDFDGREALLFAQTRLFGDAPGPPDFIRVANHQDLLLGLLAGLQERDAERGFVESMALSAIEGIDAEDASPLDLYRLLNALTSVKRGKADGCVLVGREEEDAAGNQIIIADADLADRLGREAADDATFESGCEPEGSG